MLYEEVIFSNRTKIKKIHLDPKTKQSHLPWKIHEINATVTPKRRLFNCLKQRVQDVLERTLLLEIPYLYTKKIEKQLEPKFKNSDNAWVTNLIYKKDKCH